MAMKLYQFYTRTIPRSEPLNANGKEPGAEVGQGNWQADCRYHRAGGMPTGMRADMWTCPGMPWAKNDTK